MLVTVNTKMHVFKHPKYYEEFRKRAKAAQKEAKLKLQVASSKPQAKPEPSSGSQDARRKPQAPSSRVQASSHKHQAS